MDDTLVLHLCVKLTGSFVGMQQVWILHDRVVDLSSHSLIAAYIGQICSPQLCCATNWQLPYKALSWQVVACTCEAGLAKLWPPPRERPYFSSAKVHSLCIVGYRYAQCL